MEQDRNERAGELGDLRVKPPTSGIVRHMRESESDPVGDRNRIASMGSELTSYDTTATPIL